MNNMEEKKCPTCGDIHTETNCNGYCSAWCYEEKPSATVEEAARDYVKDIFEFDYKNIASKAFEVGYNYAQSKPEPMERKSLQECKDEVAKAWQYEDWKQATNITSPNLLKFVLKLTDEAAEMYASQFKR